MCNHDHNQHLSLNTKAVRNFLTAIDTIKVLTANVPQSFCLYGYMRLFDRSSITIRSLINSILINKKDTIASL